MDDIFDLAANDECGTQHTFDNISQLAPSYSWLEMLNPEQKEAVKTTEGPVLVLSGAGTGKTKVLTTRLAYILSQHKANPWNCLVVTFTNRAAREMRERVQGLIGEIANSVWLGTFHSICVKILRNHAEMVGLKSNFTILNEDDQKRIIKQLLEADAIDDKKYPPQSILDRISRWKDKGLTTDKVSNESRENILVNIYKKYQERLLELNCVDFGDIILHTITILLSDKDVLEKYQNRFRYIMVDEYQDTNVSQYLLIRLLSQKYRNLCCVGDDDQSIYSWRGAEIENILRFNKDFPDARTIRLERNYRSTANILKAASNLISNNQDRLGKTLKVAEHSPAHQCENSKIKVISTYNGTEEAQYVVDEIENLTRQNYQYSDMAILVRTAAQTREFEEKLIHEAIPYQVIGGLKFYERAEIRDALAYFRVVLQPDDDLALERIINKPARGIGAKSVEKFRNEARLRHCSMYNAIKQMLNEGNISGKSKNSLEQLINNFEDWRKASTALTPDDLAAQIIEDSGYFDMLKADKSVEAPGRIENLKELINSMDDKFSNLSEFMEHVSLVMDKDDITDNNKVMLITLHSAKGLEFNIVFLPGWEEGLFPHQRALDEGGTSALEEERRLAYVAITRARQKLYISMAHNRRVYGQWQNNLPSRFLNELPPSTIEICNKASSYFGSDNYGSSGRYNGGYNKNSYQSPSSATRYDDDDRYSYVSNDEYDNAWGNIYKAKQQAKNQHADYPLGTKVYHESWGIGKVVAIDGNKLGIIFENVGLKRILKDYVRKA